MSAQEPVWADAYGPGVQLHLDYGDATVLDLLERSVERYADRSPPTSWAPPRPTASSTGRYAGRQVA